MLESHLKHMLEAYRFESSYRKQDSFEHLAGYVFSQICILDNF